MKKNLTSHSSFLILLIFIFTILFSACKKPCILEPKEGYKIVGSDKNCYYEQIGTPLTLDPEIKNISDLKNKLEQIEKELSSGKSVALKIMDQLATTEEQFLILKEFGGLQIKYGGKLTIDWNGKDVCPAKPGVLLNFYEWNVEMNKMPLGVGESGGAKAVIQWDIGENEWQLFLDAGVDGAVLAPGNSVYNINTYEDLWNAPAAIINGFQPGKLTRLKFNQTLPQGFRNGADAFALRELCAGQAKGKWEYQNINSQKKQYWANDSVNVFCATVVHGMKEILQPAPFGGGKYAVIDLVAPNSLDSVPSNQFVRVSQRNSDQLNWSKFVPNKIDITNEWNVGDIPSNIYNTWQSNIKLEAADRPDKPGGKQNTVGTDSLFLDYYEAPAGPAKAGVPFKFVADEDLILAEYYSVDQPGPPPGTQPLGYLLYILRI